MNNNYFGSQINPAWSQEHLNKSPNSFYLERRDMPVENFENCGIDKVYIETQGKGNFSAQLKALPKNLVQFFSSILF